MMIILALSGDAALGSGGFGQAVMMYQQAVMMYSILIIDFEPILP